jgi:folate-binding protein YgfZ
MRSLHETAGAVFGEVHGVSVPRHYGDPSSEYGAAVDSVAVADRSHRTRIRISGRAPAQMLQGFLSGRIPEPPFVGGLPASGPNSERTRWEYSLVLTPKARILTDLRVTRLAGDDEVFLFDVPLAGTQVLSEHMARSLPPRLASSQDVSAETGMLTVMGPQSAELLSREVLGLRIEETELREMKEGDGIRIAEGSDGVGISVVRTADVATAAFDVISNCDTTARLWTSILETGASPVGHGVFQALRVEAGRPELGVDMGEDTLPPEAGLADRGIDHAKGCYTGQEVIVRIRDRGHVNRRLCGLLLGDGASPSPGTELCGEDGGERVGVITSVAHSPRAEGVIGLGYVRREIGTPGVVRVGAAAAEAQVRELAEGWAF